MDLEHISTSDLAAELARRQTRSLKTCAYCGCAFAGTRKQTYCSTLCRVKAFQHRRRERG